MNECQASNYVTIVEEGEHSMVANSNTSPRITRGLTDEVKAMVHEAISCKYGVAPHVVLTNICARIPDRAPLESQVQGYMQRWRRINRDDSLDPVIDICKESMFELVPNAAQSGERLFVFCDSRRTDSGLVPDIGDASDEFPFRIGLTCYSMLETYINTQQDPRCSTILHVDSTHNMVRQKYNVFILGISDSCGHFFPVVYYCSSQRRAEDVGWCLSYLKRVIKRLFAVDFAQQFVMTDADKAQFKACATELPKTKVLMC